MLTVQRLLRKLSASLALLVHGRFTYSSDGKNFSAIGEPFTVRPGKWIGAKVGIFAVRNGSAREIGYADFDWF
ncbi:MAG TPA: hypothetical protein VGN86_13335 [Pyrinomonadaceae bacterium]|jgi:hypothetical protein|nr:hypothetical protein [Pyrinomonadaceae bacterium]